MSKALEDSEHFFKGAGVNIFMKGFHNHTVLQPMVKNNNSKKV